MALGLTVETSDSQWTAVATGLVGIPVSINIAAHVATVYNNGTSAQAGIPTGDQDANGFTVVPEASADTTTIYVSTSGSDSANGLTSGTAVQTIAHALSLFPAGHPAWLLLKCGDTWTTALGIWQWSGNSATEVSLISSYGSGAPPKIDYAEATHFELGIYGKHHLYIIGIDFTAHTRNPSDGAYSATDAGRILTAMHIGRDATNILLEDCAVSWLSGAFNFSNEDAPIAGVRVRRCKISNVYTLAGSSGGMFMDWISDVTIEDNVCDYCGWNPDTTPREWLNHSMYLSYDSSGWTTQNNLVTRGSGNGIMQRASGLCTGNLFSDNANSIVCGNTGSDGTHGYLSDAGTITNNTILHSIDLKVGTHAGSGIHISTSNPASLVDGNIMAHCGGSDNSQTPQYQNCGAVVIDEPLNHVDNQPFTTTITLTGNVVYDWHSTFLATDDVLTTGTHTIRTITYTLGSNQVSPYGLLDPTRDIAAYSAYLGDAGTLDDFVAKALANRKSNYDVRYTTQAANTWIRAGYNK